MLGNLRRALPHLPKGALVLISAQLPVGTCAKLEKEFPQFHFACSPENLRLGKAIDAFEKAERAIVGIRNDAKKALLEQLFKPFAAQTIFMRTESAEMVKHALNSFLALSITFINEVARLCEHTGADAKEVSIGLKSEARIGPKAYLGPGGPFAGGTLARDVVTLSQAGRGERRKNFRHSRHQAKQRPASRLGVSPAAIAPRRFARQKDFRARPDLHDEHRHAPPQRRRGIVPAASGRRRKCFRLRSGGENFAGRIEIPVFARAADIVAPRLTGAEAVAVCTEWPQFRQADWAKIIPQMRQPVFVDANRFLEKELKNVPGVEHLSVGRA